MRIAVTGIGMVSAIGMNCAETRKSLLEERSGIGTMRVLGSRHTDIPVGEVPYTDEQLKRMAGIDAAEPMPRTSLLGILAAREALQKAQMPDGFAFISGTTVGGRTVYATGTTVQSVADVASITITYNGTRLPASSGSTNDFTVTSVNARVTGYTVSPSPASGISYCPTRTRL